MSIISDTDEDFNTFFIEYITNSVGPVILDCSIDKLEYTRSIYDHQEINTFLVYYNQDHNFYIGTDPVTGLTAYISVNDFVIVDH